MADSITSFEVYRSATEGQFSATPLATLPGTARSYDDSTAPSPRFWYKLIGRTAAGLEIPYNIVSIGPNTWAKGFGGTSFNYGQAVAVDAEGNIFFLGHFAGTTDFGDGQGNKTSAGILDLFLVKLSSSGTVIWAKKYGGSSQEFMNGLALSPTGDIYVVGSMNHEGTSNLGGDTFTSQGQLDIIVAKYDSSGIHQWSKRFGSHTDEDATCAACGPDGHLVLGGAVGFGGVNFGGGALYSQSGNPQIVLAKLSSVDGSHIWSKTFISNSCIPRGIAIDSNNDVFVGTDPQGNFRFDDGTVLTPNRPIPYPDKCGVFFKLNGSNGARIWAYMSDTTGYHVIPNNVALDYDGNPIFVGYFTGPSVNFGNGVTWPNNRTGNNTAFVVKRSGATGEAMWAAGSTNPEITSLCTPKAIAVKSNGSIVVAGVFGRTCTFDNQTLTVGSGSSQEVFVATYSSSGAVIGLIKFGNTSGSVWVGVSNQMAAYGNFVLIPGTFLSTVNFAGTTLTNHSSYDAFLVKV